MSAVTWIYAIEEADADVLSIPSPPVPFRQFVRKGRVKWPRRTLHTASLVSACFFLASVVLMLGRIAG